MAGERGYHRIVVPLIDAAQSERAVEVASRLAADRASIIAVWVIEVPPVLPLDAHMEAEELDARRLHRAATEIADAYGVRLVARTVRARDAGTAILEEIDRVDADFVVIGAERRTGIARHRSPFDRNVQHVLKKAPCRVLVVAAPAPA
jgi:basic amino acid/polyamine antiporter, APA family